MIILSYILFVQTLSNSHSRASTEIKLQHFSTANLKSFHNQKKHGLQGGQMVEGRGYLVS